MYASVGSRAQDNGGGVTAFYNDSRVSPLVVPLVQSHDEIDLGTADHPCKAFMRVYQEQVPTGAFDPLFTDHNHRSASFVPTIMEVVSTPGGTPAAAIAHEIRTPLQAVDTEDIDRIGITELLFEPNGTPLYDQGREPREDNYGPGTFCQFGPHKPNGKGIAVCIDAPGFQNIKDGDPMGLFNPAKLSSMVHLAPDDEYERRDSFVTRFEINCSDDQASPNWIPFFGVNWTGHWKLLVKPRPDPASLIYINSTVANPDAPPTKDENLFIGLGIQNKSAPEIDYGEFKDGVRLLWSLVSIH